MKLLNVIFFFTIAFSLTGCSAAILSVGQNDTDIIYYNAEREDIIKHLGEAVKIEEIKSEITLEELREKNLSEKKVYTIFLPLEDVPERVKVNFSETYIYKGRIVRSSNVGDAYAASMFTLGLSEIELIPKAISHQNKSPDTIHTVTVWYDESKIARAYTWEESIRQHIEN